MKKPFEISQVQNKNNLSTLTTGKQTGVTYIKRKKADYDVSTQYFQRQLYR